MQTIIELPGGRAAQLIYYEVANFGGNNHYELKWLLARLKPELTQEDLEKIKQLKKIKGMLECLPVEVKIANFEPVAFQYIPTAVIFKWTDIEVIYSAIRAINADLKSEGEVPIWDEENGLWENE